jgi:hypothetical protein
MSTAISRHTSCALLCPGRKGAQQLQGARGVQAQLASAACTAESRHVPAPNAKALPSLFFSTHVPDE